ncbi:hypothetical protein KJ780_03770, partial [Candidatus Micrarchaeota archaeon]|nr:hypothetical protein [Candidatus Micrarchaeota archaeon]
ENNIQTVFHLKKKGVGEKVRTAAEHASESLGMKRVRNLEEHVSSNAINELSIIASDIDYPDSVRTEALAAIRRLDQRIKEEQTPNVRKLIEIVRTAESFETRAAALQKIADMPNKCQYSNLSSPDAELLNKIAKTQGTPIKYRINAAQIIISLYERRGELYRLREMHYNEEYPKKTRDQAKEAIERMQFSQIESHDKKNALSELLRLAEAGFTDAVKEKAGLSLVEIHTKKEDVKRLDALISNPSCMPSVVEAAKVAKSRIVSALEIRFHAGRARRDGEFQKWLPPKDRTILAGGGAHQRFRKPTLVKL